jgi:hypothetical protein
MSSGSMIKGSGTGAANAAWFGFYESNGTTRTGFVGDGSTGDSDITLQSDSGNVKLVTSGGTGLVVDTSLRVATKNNTLDDGSGNTNFNGNANFTGTVNSGGISSVLNSGIPQFIVRTANPPTVANPEFHFESNRNALTQADFLSWDGTTLKRSLSFNTSGKIWTAYNTLDDGSGNMGIGIDQPSERLHIKQTSDAVAFCIEHQSVSTRKSHINTGTNGSVLDAQGAATGYGWHFLVNGSEYMRLTNAGRLGIGQTNPSALLDVNGTANVTALKIGYYQHKYLGSIGFPNATANQKIDVYLPTTLSGWFEIEITGGYNYSCITGRLTKRFDIYAADPTVGTISYQQAYYTNSSAKVGRTFAISDVKYDSTNKRFYVTIANQSTNGNTISINITGQCNGNPMDLTTATVGSIYTTDSSTLTAPFQSIDSNLKVLGNGGSIGGSDITQGFIQVGTTLGIDPNEMYCTTDLMIGTIGSGTALNFRPNATTVMKITDTGYVGINNTIPGTALDVSGTARVTKFVSGSFTMQYNSTADSLDFIYG